MHRFHASWLAIDSSVHSTGIASRFAINTPITIASPDKAFQVGCKAVKHAMSLLAILVAARFGALGKGKQLGRGPWPWAHLCLLSISRSNRLTTTV